MIDPDSIRVDREIWAAPDGVSLISGLGTRDNPYRLPSANLDALLPLLGNSCRLHLLAGEFSANRFFPLPKTILTHGAGRAATRIKLSDNAATNLFWPHMRMFSDGGTWLREFALTDLTLDGNWANQPAHPSLKIDPIVIQTLVGLVRNVCVENFGANGTSEGQKGLEAFGIGLHTIPNGGSLDEYNPQWRYLHRAEPTTRLEVIDCIVQKPFFVWGGTCTGIFLTTAIPNANNRQPFGTRQTEAGLIRGCSVNVPGGNAYGGASLEMVTFEDNTATDCMCGLNIDTHRAERITVRNNRFFNCSSGPNISPSGQGKGIRIDGNFIQLGRAFWNEVMHRFEPQWGIRSHFTTDSSANRNTLLLPDAWGITPFSGIDGDNRIILQSGDGDSGELIQAKAEIAALKSERDYSQNLLSTIQPELAESKRVTSALIAQLSETTRRADASAWIVSRVKEALGS